jgi:N-acetylglucosaminyldiphosphoundecaprenol N-acetyl-beta-D-mannosaminyltransferase
MKIGPLAKTQILSLRINLGAKRYFAEVILRESFKMAGQTVITVNTAHLNSLRNNSQYQIANQNALLVLPDGWPIALLASLAVKKIQKRVTGSDLIPYIFNMPKEKILKIAILGVPSSFDAKLDQLIFENTERIDLVYKNSMPQEVFNSPLVLGEIAQEVSKSSPNLIITCFGSPKQEIFNEFYLRNTSMGVAIGVGATLDFLLGAQRRSPLVFRLLGLEWAFRLIRNPRRLFRRYLIATIEFSKLLLEYLFQKRTH